jgi:hypothetical protein
VTVAVECPCGQVHELRFEARIAYEKVTRGLPPDVVIKTPAGVWRVPRIYVAVHGVRAAEMPALAERYGFPRL